MKTLVTIAAICATCGALTQGQPASSYHDLYARHLWFELRDAIDGKRVAPLYAGAVASAFNRTGDAERLLRAAVREAPTVEAANDAREALGAIYMRLGRSADLLRVFDAAVAAAPSSSIPATREARSCGAGSRATSPMSSPPGVTRPGKCTRSAAPPSTRS